MTSQTGPCPGEPLDSAGEVGGDLARSARGSTGGGEFDGQRQTGDLPADLAHGDEVACGQRESGPGRACAVGEQSNRALLGQRLDNQTSLARHPEWPAAGGQDADLSRVLDDLVREPRNRVAHVLAVVQNEKRPPPSEHLTEALDDRATVLRPAFLMRVLRGNLRRVATQPHRFRPASRTKQMEAA